MDNSFSIKPRPAATGGGALRDPVTVRETNDTELDAAKSVTASSDSGTKHDGSRHDEPHAHDVIIDPESREALFNAMDVRSEHPEQSPNQALMRQRAYGRAQPKQPATEPHAADPHADFET